jgi:hypothetical protein
VRDRLERAFHRAKCRRVGEILDIVDQHHMGLDLRQVDLGTVVVDRFDFEQRVVGVAAS